jgi:hypothetical protein
MTLKFKEKKNNNLVKFENINLYLAEPFYCFNNPFYPKHENKNQYSTCGFLLYKRSHLSTNS